MQESGVLRFRQAGVTQGLQDFCRRGYGRPARVRWLRGAAMDMWTFKTQWGVFGIVQKSGRFHAMFGSEHLGAYATPRQALDDLVNGHTLSLSNGLDSSEAGLPEELSEWTYQQIGA